MKMLKASLLALASLLLCGSLSAAEPIPVKVVVVTMFAAHSFDPRLIWDNVRESEA